MRLQFNFVRSIVIGEMYKFPEIASMCQPNDTNFPDWINSYQPVDSVDETLLDYFRQLYSYDYNSKDQQRVIQKIWNQLHSKNLISKSEHPDFNDVYSEIYIWLNKPLLIINDSILELLNEYCRTSTGEIVSKLSNHLQKITNYNIHSKEYRKEIRYIRDWTEKLMSNIQSSSNQNDTTKQLNNSIKRVPRIWLFKPGGASLISRLASWVNDYIKWRLLDLYISDQEMPDSLDIPLFDNDTSGENIIDNIPDGFHNLYNAPTLEELQEGNLINELSTQDYQQFLLVVKEYLEQDPFEFLRSRYVTRFPECHYKLLVDRLILKEPPDTIRAIAQDFHIAEQTFYSECSRNFYPIISSIYIELGYNLESLKTAIIQDSDGSLKKCKKVIKKQVVYDAQSLAQQLLPLFQPPQKIFTTVIQFLGQQGHLLKSEIVAIYNDEYFSIYAKIAEDLHQQGYQVQPMNNEQAVNRNVNSYDVLSFWETATFDKIVVELSQQNYQVTAQEIKDFWDRKCRKCLGKLAIELSQGRQ